MKKYIIIFLSFFSAACLAQAQTADTITNNSVIKMVKANLSGDLIIDMIENSITDFDLSENAVQRLRQENVPDEIIKEMQKKNPDQGKEPESINNNNVQVAAVKEPDVKQQPQEKEKIPDKAEGEIASGRSVEAHGYVAPLKALVTYYENEFEVMSVTISEWDRQIRSSLAEGAGINKDISDIEAGLREKKNASADNYDSSILLLYKSLYSNRLKYKELKEKMMKDGALVTKKLADMNKEKEHSLGKIYDEISQQVKSFESDPSKADETVKVSFSALKINDQTADAILPATEMLYWYRNELNKVYDLIEEWNKKADEITVENDALNERLKPLQTQMDEYKTNPKKFKSEISALKKQISSVEKEKRQLAGKMGTESSQMADELKKRCKEVQGSARERFNDIIANINYYYQEKFNL